MAAQTRPAITDRQIAFFYDLYDREVARTQNLIDRGKIYVSLVSLFFGSAFFKFDWLYDNWNCLGFGKWLLVAGFSPLGLALVLLGIAIQFLNYIAYTESSPWFRHLRRSPMSDQLFAQLVMTTLAVAEKETARRNNVREWLLLISLGLIALGAIMIGFAMGFLIFEHYAAKGISTWQACKQKP